MATQQDPCAVLLITSNIALAAAHQFVLDTWSKELAEKIKSANAGFVAVHLQEVGSIEGKSLEETAVVFARSLLKLLHGYHVHTLCNADEKDAASFSALGAIFLVRTDVNIRRWNFQASAWARLPADEVTWSDICDTPYGMHCKFTVGMFNQHRNARKGFLQTRWCVAGQELDLVNVHLYHDACNLRSSSKWPSEYALTRREALSYVLSTLQRDLAVRDTRSARKRVRPAGDPRPLFVFGDFNFRLDLPQFLQHHFGSGPRTTEQIDGEEQHTFSQPDKSLVLKTKHFEFQRQADLDLTRLLQFDKESKEFADRLLEDVITFPPSYPYDVPGAHEGHGKSKSKEGKAAGKDPAPASKEAGHAPEGSKDASHADGPASKGKKDKKAHKDGARNVAGWAGRDGAVELPFASSRCPAWCDRVLMSAVSRALIKACANREYGILGLKAHIGDHKPVFLQFSV
eukprot:m.248281 g.248281  ORF g.248281 m.248281 type:complete len:458 (-) comp15688_c0_seq1:120-1493(-)